MNRIFKKVFNRKTGEYVVASEAAKGGKKSSTGKKSVLALAVAFATVGGHAATLANQGISSSLNGTQMGAGGYTNINESYHYNQGIRIGANATYENSNTIGANELNTTEQQAAGINQDTIKNYSQNIGQANNVNLKLSQMALSSSYVFGGLNDDYQKYYIPNFLTYMDEIPDSQQEIYNQAVSEINDTLNQKINPYEGGYNAVELPKSTKLFGGNNNINSLSYYNYQNQRDSDNTIAVGRDNSFNANSNDTTVIGNNNTLSVTTTEEGYELVDSMSNFIPLDFISQELTPEEIEMGYYPYTYANDKAIFTKFNNIQSNATVTGSQSTVIGNNTVVEGINNIVIGSTSKANVAQALESRDTYLTNFNEITSRLYAFSEESEEKYYAILDKEYESDEEFETAIMGFYQEHLPQLNALRSEYSLLIANHMDASTELSAGVTANDSIAIGVNAKAVNDKAKWWKNLLEETKTNAEDLIASTVVDEYGNIQSISNPTIEEYWLNNHLIEDGGCYLDQYEDRKSQHQVAIGYQASSNHDNSVAIGINSSTKEANSIDFGLNRVTNVSKAIDATDAMTVQNLKDNKDTTDYSGILYQPFLDKSLARTHLQADVIQESKDYSDKEDIRIQAEITQHLKEKTDNFVVATVADNTKEIESQVATITAKEINSGTAKLKETTQQILGLYEDAKNQVLANTDEKIASNSSLITSNLNDKVSASLNGSRDNATSSISNTNNSLLSALETANVALNDALNVKADALDEQTDKAILEALLGKLSTINLNGSNGGEGEGDNGLTPTFNLTLENIYASDQVLLNNLNQSFKDLLAEKQFDVGNAFAEDNSFNQELIAKLDDLQAKAIEQGSKLIDEKDANTQNLVFNTVNKTITQGNQALINTAKSLDDAVYKEATTTALLKNLAIEETLLNTATAQDAKILEASIAKANEQDQATATAALNVADKGDAQVLATVSNTTDLLGSNTTETAKTYANEQDKLVYNRMLEVLANSPTNSISNIYSNINSGDLEIISTSAEYIVNQDKLVLEQLQSYADVKSHALEKSFNDQTKRMEAGVASAVAASMLGQSTIPGAHTLGAAVGVYGDKVSYAVGASTMTPDAKYVLKAGFTVNSDNRFGFMSGAGFYVD